MSGSIIMLCVAIMVAMASVALLYISWKSECRDVTVELALATVGIFFSALLAFTSIRSLSCEHKFGRWFYNSRHTEVVHVCKSCNKEERLDVDDPSVSRVPVAMEDETHQGQVSVSNTCPTCGTTYWVVLHD